MAQRVKRLPAVRKTRVQSLGRDDPLAKEMTTHSSTLVWKIPLTEESGRLQSVRSRRVRFNSMTSLSFLRYLQCAQLCALGHLTSGISRYS